MSTIPVEKAVICLGFVLGILILGALVANLVAVANYGSNLDASGLPEIQHSLDRIMQALGI